MRKTIAALTLAGLTACGNLGYVAETYSGTSRNLFENGGKTWWIYDRPDMSRLMVNAPIGDAMTAGATFGMVETQYPAFASAGRAFLASTGRDCALGEGREVVNLQVEFPYTC